MAGEAQDLIIRMRVENGRVAAADVEGVNTALGRTDERARQAHNSIGRLSGGFGGLRRIVSIVTGAVGLGGMALGLGEMIKNAEAFQAATSQLGQAIKANVIHPAKNALAVMKDYADHLAAHGGFAPPQEILAMTQIMRIAHDTGRTMKGLALATDIARGSHKQLAVAARAVAMVEGGRLTMLTRLGIVLPKHISAAAAYGVLMKRYAGATDAYNKTAAGSMQNFMHALDMVGEHLGTLLVPPLTKAFNWLSAFTTKLMDASTGPGKTFHHILKDIAGVLKIVWAAIKDVVGAVTWLVDGWRKNNKVAETVVYILGAMAGIALALWITNIVRGVKEWVASQWLLNAALDANPVGLVVVAIGALVGMFVLAYTKVKWFRDGVNAVFDWLKNAAADVIKFISHHWWVLGTILGGPFVGLAVFVATHFNDVKKVVIDIINWMIDRWNGLPFIHGFHIGPIHVPGLPKFHHLGGGGSSSGHGTNFGRQTGNTLPHRGGKWMGGPITHGGVYTVGEHGREDIYLPGGSHVDPGDSASALGDAVANALSGAAVFMDGRQVGQLIVRQGAIQKARQ